MRKTGPPDMEWYRCWDELGRMATTGQCTRPHAAPHAVSSPA